VKKTSVSKPIETKPDDPVFRVFNEVGIIAQLGSTLFERVMPTGMTIAQFTVLNHFVRLGGVKRPSELASAFQVSRGTMTSTLSRLEAKGLVSSTADGTDGRGRLVSITDAGTVMRETCLAALQPVIVKLTAALGIDVFEAALPSLITMRRELDNMRDVQGLK
jgi:DNA-binding MarR family transcriptional regulator